MCHDWMGLHMGWWGSGGMMILGIVVLVAVFMRRNGGSKLERTPMDILDDRLAAGELTPAEYREVLQELER